MAVAQNPALFLTNHPFSPDPQFFPVPPGLEGLTLPTSLTGPLGYFSQNVVRDVVAWDFDGDGDKDLLLCGSVRLFLLRNGPAGASTASIDQPWGVFSDASNLLATASTQWGGTFLRDFIVEAAAVGDLDGDGREDLALAASATTQVIFTVTSPGGTLTLNLPTINSTTNWASPPFGWQQAVSTIRELVVIDVKGGPQGTGAPDGMPDIVAARTDSSITSTSGTTFYPGRVLVAVNTGNGVAFVDGSPPGLPIASATPGNCNAMSVSVVDVDGQFGPDLFLGVTQTLGGSAGPVSGQNRLFLNQPTGWLEMPGAFPTTQTMTVLGSRPTDFNGDAFVDFAIITPSDTRGLLGSGSLTWSVGPVVLVPPNARAVEHELAVADFDHDGVADLLDPSGAFWAGGATGLVANNIVVVNQTVTTTSHWNVNYGMLGAVADFDLDGDVDWAGVSMSTTGQAQFELWANLTRQLDFDDPALTPNSLDISASSLPINTKFWCYDRSSSANMLVIPFLAADLGPAPIRITVPPFEGLLGLNMGSAVTIGGVANLLLPFPTPGQLLRDHVPLTFPAGLPVGGVLFYQALNVRLDAISGAAAGGSFTNVLRVSITP